MLQDRGFDTYTANELLGFPADARDYGDAIIALKHVLGKHGKSSVRLLSNNPEKRAELESSGLKVLEMLKLVVGVNECNLHYLETKSQRGHTISLLDLNLI
jgi:3,4-dihydroxy 2-butanone 4-phosphate synthase/GTP cyclohydrolase II